MTAMHHAIWCGAIVSKADELGEDSPFAQELADIVRTVLGVYGAAVRQLARAAIADRRSAYELSAAYLREYTRRRPDSRPWVDHAIQQGRGRAPATPHSGNPALIACAGTTGPTREA